MAAKKTSAPTPTLTTAALRHGNGAFGAKYVKPGFAFTPEMDLAFALGYPHLIHLADGHPADADPAVKGPEWVADNLTETPVWPREVANRAARAWTSLRKPPDRAARFKEDKGPIGPDEAREIIGRWLRATRGDVLLLLLEAMVGPDAVAQGAIAAMESYDLEGWDGPNFDTAAFTLGFLLLRLPAAAAAEAHARLETLFARVQKNGWATKSIQNLDVMLHGVEGAERSGYRPDGKHLSPIDATLVCDDPTWVTKIVLASGPPDASLWPDPRLAFLGGASVLEAECSWWKSYTKPGSPALFVERFGHVRSEALLPVFLEMTTASKAKKEATAWFVTHADFARPFLASQAKGKNAAAAQAVLKAIGG